MAEQRQDQAQEQVQVQPQKESRVGCALDWLMVGLIIVSVVGIGALLVVFYWMWWTFLKEKPPELAQWWAIAATTLLFPITALGVYLGVRLGAHRAEWLMQGVDRTMDRLARSVLATGVQAADVRVYAGKGLGILKRESTGSQEVYMDDMPTPYLAESGGDIDPAEEEM